MRLIDADKLKESILLIKKCWGCSPVLSDDEKSKALSDLSVAIRKINEAPTAYDVDKVVGRIEKIMEDETIRFADQVVRKSIKIVKAGGVDE